MDDPLNASGPRRQVIVVAKIEGDSGSDFAHAFHRMHLSLSASFVASVALMFAIIDLHSDQTERKQ